VVKLFRCDRPTQAGEHCDAFSGRFQTIIAVKRSNPVLRARHRGQRLAPSEIQHLPRVDEEFTALCEDWNRYRLATGNLLRVKPVATLVQRVDGAWDEFDDPVYAVSSVNVLQTVKRSSGAARHG
jgi:hypothetical protein